MKKNKSILQAVILPILFALPVAAAVALAFAKWGDQVMDLIRVAIKMAVI